jgi:hypothetical protein
MGAPNVSRSDCEADLGGDRVDELREDGPLSQDVDGAGGDVLLRVRTAVAAGDRTAALRLLQAYVRGEVDLSGLPQPVGDALVATAGGQDDRGLSTTALDDLARRDTAREQVIQLLTASRFGTADLALSRRVLDALGEEARDREEATRQVLAHAASGARRVGSVWLELKYIPDADSGKTYGPYLYGRWRESGRKRSRYIGKA